MTQSQLFSNDLLAVAEALRRIRTRLYELVRAGTWPEGAFQDMSRVLNDGLYVAQALERLGGAEPPPRSPTPYDPDVRM